MQGVYMKMTKGWRERVKKFWGKYLVLGLKDSILWRSHFSKPDWSIFSGNLHLNPSGVCLFVCLQADPKCYKEMQRDKDSCGSLEKDLDYRHQNIYKVIVIKTCQLVWRGQWNRIENLKTWIYIYVKAGAAVEWEKGGLFNKSCLGN